MLRAVNNYVVGITLREATESRAAGMHDTAAYQVAVASYLQQIAANRRYPLMASWPSQWPKAATSTPTRASSWA